MPTDILKQVKEFWDKLSKKVKKIIIISTAAVVVISIASSILLNLKVHEVLYSGLSSTEQSEIVSRLGELGVDFKTQGGGIVLVPSKEVDSLKMKLSSEGYPKSALSYDMFKSSSDFMSTDYDKKQFLIFQLQDRLQNSIKTLSGVKDAIVNISIANESTYVLDEDKVPTTAMLILDLEAGVTLTPLQVKGIENIIAKSVPGLESKDVSIIDQSGTILNPHSEDGTGTSLDYLEKQKAAGDLLKNKIITLLQPLYGKNGVSVGVNVAIDFSQKTSNETLYSRVDEDKDTSKNGEEDEDVEAVIDPDTGEVSVKPTDTKETPKSELVNQVQNQIIKNGGEIKDITAAIIINKKLSEDEKTNVNKIVSFALGVKENRIVISDIEFAAANELQQKAMAALKEKPSFLEQNAIYLIIFAGVVVLALIILIIIKRAKKKKHEIQKEIYKGIKPIGQASLNDEIPAIVLNETRELGLKRQIKDFSSSNPEIVAQLLRTWIKEENN
jgi:flagellar M-ring protein FliF